MKPGVRNWVGERVRVGQVEGVRLWGLSREGMEEGGVEGWMARMEPEGEMMRRVEGRIWRVDGVREWMRVPWMEWAIIFEVTQMIGEKRSKKGIWSERKRERGGEKEATV